MYPLFQILEVLKYVKIPGATDSGRPCPIMCVHGLLPPPWEWACFHFKMISHSFSAVRRTQKNILAYVICQPTRNAKVHENSSLNDGWRPGQGQYVISTICSIMGFQTISTCNGRFLQVLKIEVQMSSKPCDYFQTYHSNESDGLADISNGLLCHHKH